MREFNEPKRRVPLNKGKKKKKRESQVGKKKKTANRESVNGEKKKKLRSKGRRKSLQKTKKRTFVFSAVFFLCHTDNK